MKLPSTGLPRDALYAELEAVRAKDADWRRGRTFGLVYYAGDEILDVLRHAYGAFIHENGLSLDAFPSLKHMEGEVLAWCADLFGGGEATAGSMTSGGTESILMAVKTAREHARARRPDLRDPVIVVPITAHPAFDKAAHTLGVGIVHVDVGADGRVTAEAMRAAIDERTILLVGSAYAFPHGVVDPIPELGQLALERDLLLHVDACLGGFVLAFDPTAPPYDLRVPGVSSLSADLHKYGYAAKGASIVLYRDKKLRRHQLFAYGGWPGGLYGSPTMAGTRPGGGIAAAWAVMRYLGRDGYERLVREVLDTSARLRAGIAAVPGLALIGDARHSVMAFTAADADVYAIGDEMHRRGWHLDRQQKPPSLHLMVTPAHGTVVEAFLADLAEATALARAGKIEAMGPGAFYGAIATLPDRGMVEDLILDFMDAG